MMAAKITQNLKTRQDQFKIRERSPVLLVFVIVTVLHGVAQQFRGNAEHAQSDSQAAN